jgi:hypothetical protein
MINLINLINLINVINSLTHWETPTSGLVLLECRPTTKRAQAMHKELRMAWGIAVEPLSATWGGWCLACGQKRSITVCISQCNRKSLLYPASVERDCSAHPCPLSGQPFRSSFCVPDDSIHTVDRVQISSRSLFLKRLLSPSLYRYQCLVSTYFNLKPRIPSSNGR